MGEGFREGWIRRHAGVCIGAVPSLQMVGASTPGITRPLRDAGGWGGGAIRGLAGPYRRNGFIPVNGVADEVDHYAVISGGDVGADDVARDR